MNIFLSWSGERSRRVAGFIHDWLPMVVQSVVPFFSVEDIDKGARWLSELNSKLDKHRVGIICVTPENVQAPWLLFEAGSLSNVLDSSHVCTLLFGLEPTDLQGPLAQFQATRATKDEVLRLVETINRLAAMPLDDDRLRRVFDRLWPDLEKNLPWPN